MKPFWESKTLAQMSRTEWESLCDGCGLCCLFKLEDEETGEVFYTDVACRFLDHDSCRCRDYPHRQQQVPDCLRLSLAQPEVFALLPGTCAYRRLFEGQPLPEWHPLRTGLAASVHQAGISVRGCCVSEDEVDLDDLEEHIVHWVS